MADDRDMEMEEGLLGQEDESRVVTPTDGAGGSSSENVGMVARHQRARKYLAGIPEEDHEESKRAQEEEERASKRVKLAEAIATVAALKADLGEGSSAGVSEPAAAHEVTLPLSDMIAHAMSEATAKLHAAQGNSSSIAKALNKPVVWTHDANGTKRADTWLKQLHAYAVAHGVQPQTILPSYLGAAVGTLYDDYVQSWDAKGIQPSWEDVCIAFKSIVGQRADLEQSKAIDDLAHLRVKQLTNQSILAYKVRLQHKIMVAGNINPALQVMWFISGLGSTALRAECQPELVGGQLKTIDDAYHLAIGKERMLEERGSKPYGVDVQLQGASSQGAPKATGSVNAIAKSTKKGKKLVNENGEFVCCKCNGTQAHPLNGIC
jgi:hypothetical protein